MLRFLLVEDDSTDRLAFERALQKSGLDAGIAFATTCAEAREQLPDQDWDCAVVDRHLPDGDGLELVPTLVGAGVPTVVLTGRDSDTEALEALDAGAQDYLVKDGLGPADLIRSLRFAMRRAGRNSATPVTLRATLDGASGPEAVLTNGQEVHRVSAPNRGTLLFLLARKLHEDRSQGIPAEDVGWYPSSELAVAIWGRNARANQLHVLVHRVGKELSDTDAFSDLIEKRRGALRVVTDRVELF